MKYVYCLSVACKTHIFLRITRDGMRIAETAKGPCWEGLGFGWITITELSQFLAQRKNKINSIYH